MARSGRLALGRIGRAAEDQALNFLQQRGLRRIARNYRCRLGEIDLIMRDGGVVVIVEVRRRAANRFAGAAASVDVHKQRKLIRTAAFFLSRNPGFDHLPMRFDVVALDVDADGGQTLTWIRDAFRPD